MKFTLIDLYSFIYNVISLKKWFQNFICLYLKYFDEKKNKSQINKKKSALDKFIINNCHPINIMTQTCMKCIIDPPSFSFRLWT